MEIALTARDEGAKVQYCSLRALLPTVEDHTFIPAAFDPNLFRVNRAKRLLKAAGIEVIDAVLTREQTRNALREARDLITKCNSTRDLCDMAIEGFPDFGWGVLSSVIESTRSPNVRLDRCRPRLVSITASSLLTYILTLQLIERHAPDLVVVFNGRFATSRAIIRAALASNVEFLIHERGRDIFHYWTSRDFIHDPDHIQSCINSFWQGDACTEAGNRFFVDRRNRVERAWFSFTKHQIRQKLPAALSEEMKWVVFFSSSEDEYAAVGDKYLTPEYPSQMDAIAAVARVVGNLPGYRLCVRIHPHIASKDPEQRKYWDRVSLPGVEFVRATEDVDSYALLERAHVVCSYGSTMGIEATYWQRPSMLLRRSLYDRLSVCENVRSDDEIRSFLMNPKVFDRSGALRYGAFFYLLGSPFKYYRPHSFRDGNFMGINLDAAVYRWMRWMVNQAKYNFSLARST